MSDELAKRITNQAVARACIALDYKYASETVIESLSDVVKMYIENIGERMHDLAENSGRSCPGIRDAIAALTDLVSNRVNNACIMFCLSKLHLFS
jgi:hypothetical protein